jgi:hypothetical protein
MPSIESTKAKRQPLEGTVATAPGQGNCAYIQIECGMQPGDSLSIGKYPDGDYVFGIASRRGKELVAATIIVAPEAMKDIVDALFKLVQAQ